AKQKCLDHIDGHAQRFIELSPFLCIGTQTADGRADVSPRGDPPGFARVADAKTLMIPDRPGNNRLDTLSNIIANASVGLIFMVPGFDETLRINGVAKISCDPEHLAGFEVNERRPKVVIVVTVDEVFLHCAKAFRRSRLWDPSAQQDRAQMPSLMKIVLDQTTGAPSEPGALRALDESLEDEYRNTMY
ncbi:MAG: MSMEG_1061 family FMN-dependent PPOX-type flavoprotein, partial [Pseudomonadota bacterium]